MGFLIRIAHLENWLRENDTDYRALTDREYAAISKKWKSRFECLINERNPTKSGDKAMTSLEARLPSNLYVFNLPGNELLPAATDTNDPAFGYFIKKVEFVERVLLNRIDAIVCDEAYDFTCLYTHEYQTLAHPEYYEAR